MNFIPSGNISSRVRKFKSYNSLVLKSRFLFKIVTQNYFFINKVKYTSNIKKLF